MSMFSRGLVAGVLLGVLGLARPVGAAEIKIGDDTTYLKLGLLLQSWGAFLEGAAPSGDADTWDTDFYVRRMRILLYGQLNEKVNFFFETDNPNLGKQGDFSSRMFIQDAWVEFNLHEALQIDVGMLLAPFSHTGMQGAVSLHSLDYHSALIRYPTGSNLVWRDYGIMMRGLVLDSLLEYRLAILNGVHGSKWDPATGKGDPRNPNDVPRVVARLTANLFDAEGGAGTGGFFWDGLYLKKTDDGIISPKKILSAGVSVDWQKDLNVVLADDNALIGRSDYLALAADLFWDLPLDEKKLLGFSGQFNFFYYDHGDRAATEGSFYNRDPKYTGEYTGYGFLSEVGLRYDAYELVLCADLFNATEADGDTGDLLSLYGGFNWWFMGHATSLKLQFGRTKKNGKDFASEMFLQAQLLF